MAQESANTVDVKFTDNQQKQYGSIDSNININPNIANDRENKASNNNTESQAQKSNDESIKNEEKKQELDTEEETKEEINDETEQKDAYDIMNTNKNKNKNEMNQPLLLMHPKPNKKNIKKRKVSKKKKKLYMLYTPSMLNGNIMNDETVLSKIEEAAVEQSEHGKCQTSNFVMDFQMDLGDFHRPNVRMINGTSSGKLSMRDRNYIKKEILKIWHQCDYAKYSRCGQHKTALFCVWLFCMGFASYLLTLLFATAINIDADYQTLINFIIYAGSISVVSCICYSLIRSIRDEVRRMRMKFLRRLKHFMHNDLKKKTNPDLFFSILYPVKMHRAGNVFSNPMPNGYYCYLRVSVGIIDCDDFEPLFDRTCNEDEIKFDTVNQHCKLHAVIKEFGIEPGGSQTPSTAAESGQKIVDTVLNILPIPR